MSGWLVRLDGDADDLSLLAEHLSSSDPNVKKEDDGYWLRHTGFDSFTEPTQVYERAMKLLGEIRGVPQLLGNAALKVEAVSLAREDDEGMRHHFMHLEGIPSDERFGMSTATFIRMIALAERNPGIAKSLNFYERGD